MDNKEKNKSISKKTEKQAGRFAAIGVLNTGIDFLLYNFFIIFLAFAPFLANIFSAGIAMVNSFYLNKRWTFGLKGKASLNQVLKFLAVTITSIYVIQTGAIYLLTEKWVLPGHMVWTAFGALGLSRMLSFSFVFNNFAKVVGIILGLIWNFILYKKWTFKE